ncbi:MAG: PEP-CTERM sorting domain-containing protein [Cyanobacteria bacterium P01_H01_bin.15]
MKRLKYLPAVPLIVIGSLLWGELKPALALNWGWSYSGSGIDASGTLTTVDTPDSLGFFDIIDVMGTRNGVEITALFPTGESIPGNEPFVVDNRISLAAEQFTTHGLGFELADNTFVNVFFASFLDPATYLEVFSTGTFDPGFENFGSEDGELPVTFDSELPVTFLATISVPEATSVPAFLALGLLGAGYVSKRRQAHILISGSNSSP